MKKKVKLVAKDAFLYLDMQLSWKKDDLSFSVYHKENQTIKYVNRESCHQTVVFKSIPAGVFTRMGRLTSIPEENKDVPIMSLCTTHANALKKANPLPKKIPMVRELYDQELTRKQQQKLKEVKKEKRKGEQRIYFVIGHARFWAKLQIVGLIKHLAKKFKLTYLCFSMAYRRFTNLQEKFQ
eukprot:12484836-Ditylum_brightwellii.AAC.1